MKDRFRNFVSHVQVYLFFPQGICYDYVELNYFLNGKSLQCPVTGIRGTVYPVFYGEGYLIELGWVGVLLWKKTIGFSQNMCCSVWFGI